MLFSGLYGARKAPLSMSSKDNLKLGVSPVEVAGAIVDEWSSLSRAALWNSWASGGESATPLLGLSCLYSGGGSVMNGGAVSWVSSIGAMSMNDVE